VVFIVFVRNIFINCCCIRQWKNQIILQSKIDRLTDEVSRYKLLIEEQKLMIESKTRNFMDMFERYEAIHQQMEQTGQVLKDESKQSKEQLVETEKQYKNRYTQLLEKYNLDMETSEETITRLESELTRIKNMDYEQQRMRDQNEIARLITEINRIQEENFSEKQKLKEKHRTKRSNLMLAMQHKNEQEMDELIASIGNRVSKKTQHTIKKNETLENKLHKSNKTTSEISKKFERLEQENLNLKLERSVHSDEMDVLFESLQKKTKVIKKLKQQTRPASVIEGKLSKDIESKVCYYHSIVYFVY
jgi:DNA repair exonuclease SbcCD ATPase subunit